ncbi:MAG: alpha/beta fold hydrolase [Planctomycetota bacterium]|nr:alpha/beta fold hydrolase [Planctomycetota bacterium]
MKRLQKMIYATAALLALLALVYVLGPRPEVDLTIQEVTLPKDLDKYLQDREKPIPDIVVGSEKTIVWADPEKKQRTEYALVYLHGFSASRQETRPLCDIVAKDLGANLYYARLVGHGRTGETMGSATLNDWLNDAYESLRIGQRLGNKVIIVGTSTGATLGTWLAAQADVNLDGLIMISPNFGLNDPRAGILSGPWGLQMMKLFLGPYRSWEGHNDLHRKYWTTRYKVEAIVTMLALVELARSAPLEQITSPTLVIYSPQDTVVDSNQITPMTESFQSEVIELVPYEECKDESQHVLAGDIISPDSTKAVADIMLEFIRKHIPPNGS